ncbi:MAG: hypothetical protein U0838_05765 [Chloroflexota bacterium]
MDDQLTELERDTVVPDQVEVALLELLHPPSCSGGPGEVPTGHRFLLLDQGSGELASVSELGKVARGPLGPFSPPLLTSILKSHANLAYHSAKNDCAQSNGRFDPVQVLPSPDYLVGGV